MSFGTMVRYELLRVVLSPLHRAAALTAVVVSVLGCLSYLVLLRQLTPGDGCTAVEAVQLALGKGSVLHLYAALHGALAVAAELGSGRAAQLLVADGRRGRWLAAKAVVAAACVLPLQAVTAAVCVPLIPVLAGAEAAGPPGLVLTVVLGGAANALLWVAYGTGLGVLLRGSPWTVPAVLALPFALGQLFRALGASTRAPEWLSSVDPFRGAELLRAPLAVDAPLVLAPGDGADATVVYFAVFALGAAMMGARSFRIRDVNP